MRSCFPGCLTVRAASGASKGKGKKNKITGSRVTRAYINVMVTSTVSNPGADT